MLTIRNQQLSTLEASARDRFFETATAHLQKFFPDRVASLEKAELHDIVSRTTDHATRQGLVTESDVLLYIDIAATYGWDFETDPTCEWMVAALADPINSSPSDRLRHLADCCGERQDRERRAQDLRREFGSVGSSKESLMPKEVGRSSDRLSTTDQASSRPIDSVAEGCPLKKKWAIEVQIVGTDSKPIDQIAVALSRAQGGELRVGSASDGSVRFTGLEAGEYSLSLQELDADTWEQIAANPLPPDRAQSNAEASWGAAREPLDPSTTDHPVVEGDCFSSLGFQHGFLPETLAKLPQNDWIGRSGRDLHVLFPGNPKSQIEGPAEVVAIPPKRLKSIKATTGMRYVFRHKGVPEFLRIQFIDTDGTPRANLPYLLEIQDPKGGPPRSVSGQTDSTGHLEEPIPPTAKCASITLGRGGTSRAIELDIGYLDPIDGIVGTQERLENLGYSCGEDDGEIGCATNWALRRFQAANTLPVTGKIDDATKAELAKQHHA